MLLPFTERGRKVLQDALSAVSTHRSECIGVEHLLLALSADGSPAAVSSHASLAETCAKINALVTENIEPGNGDGSQRVPQSPDVKQSLLFAMEESNALGHPFVNPEHLFLGVLRLESHPFVQLLVAADIDIHAMRMELTAASEHDRPTPAPRHGK